MSWLDSSHDFCWLVLDSSHVEKNGDSIRVTFFTESLESTRVTTVNNSRLESESFLQSLWVPYGQTQFVCTQRNGDFLLQWWSRLGEIFCFVCLVAMLHFKDQVSQTCVKADWDFAFTEGSVGAQYIDNLSWFNVEFAYRDHGSGSHTVTLCLFQISIKWFKFFRFKSNPKLYCKT